MSTDGKYAGHVKLECFRLSYPDNTFRVYRSVDLTEIIDYGSGAIIFNLHFSGSFDKGHYSV
jgi:hypothetical protein